MTERILNLLDRFVYSAARHGSYVLVLLAALAYNSETAAQPRGLVVMESSDHGEQSKAVLTYGRTVHDTEQIVVGLKNDIIFGVGLDRVGLIRPIVETYSITETIRHFDARGSPFA